MARHGTPSFLQRYLYYPLCGVLVVALALTLLFVFRRVQLGVTLTKRGIEHYRQGQYDTALKEFLLALECDSTAKDATLYKELCYLRLAPDPNVARIAEHLKSGNPDAELLGLTLAIERNLRGLMEDIGPLTHSDDPKVRQAAAVAVRVLGATRVRVKCLVCKRDATVTMEAGQRFPVKCPYCGQIAAYGLWYCNDCHYLWLPDGGAAWSCPECGSKNVGGAPPIGE
jgi:Zn finger protein HypA/HybF involved in hydrogenase expression